MRFLLLLLLASCASPRPGTHEHAGAGAPHAPADAAPPRPVLTDADVAATAAAVRAFEAHRADLLSRKTGEQFKIDGGIMFRIGAGP